MNKTRSKNLLPALLSALTGLVMVFVNWFLVDPLHLRALSNPLRYTINALAGLGLGWLLFHSLGAIWPWLSTLPQKTGTLRSWRGGLVLIIGIIFFCAFPLKPAPNRFSASWLEVKVTGQPGEVRLERIQVGSKTLVLGQCDREGDWNAAEDMLVVPPGGSAGLTCMLVEPGNTPVEVVFGATPKPATAEVSLDGKGETVDLSASPGGQPALTRLFVSSKIAYPLTVLIRLLDALLLILLGFGALLLDWNYRFSSIKRLAVKFAVVFNAWFDDTTPRFQGLALAASLLSAALTVFLLLQPVFSGGSPAAVQSKNKQKPPNVIFIVVDALSANDMSMFGYGLPTTPNLEKITRTWSVYSNAQSPQTCTVAALPAFMTGRYPYTNDFSAYGDRVSTKAGWLSQPQALKDAGYQTWWSGYHTPGFYHLGPGFENTVCRSGNVLHSALSRSWFKIQAISKTVFPFIPYTLNRLDIVEEGREDFDTCEELDPLASLLQTPSVKAPFFIYYHYRSVHGIPYPAGNHLGAFLPKEAGMVSRSDQHAVYGAYAPEDQPKVDELRLRYDESIADQDQKLGEFFDFLKQQGLYDSTMIIVTADHGQSFNNGYTSHCTSLISHAEAHVPLLIKYPDQTQGQRFDNLVSTVDIAPTILETAGFEVPAGWFDGISLLKQAVQPDPQRIVFTRRLSYVKALPSDLAVTDGQYRLVMRKGTLYLFDFNKDPLEKENLWEQNGYAGLPEVQRLKQALDNYRQRAQSLQQGQGILDMPALAP